MLSIRTNPHLDGRKVGLIVPSVNTTTEPEFAWIAPPGISFHAARIFMNVTSPDALRAMNAEVRHAAKQLATLSPELLAYVCTAGSFVDGVDGARALLDDLRGVVGCPIVATSVVMVEALRHLGITRLGLATPYPEEVTEAERRFLMSSGFDVVSCACLGRSGPEVRPTTFEEIFALVQSVDRPDAQGIFISCTDLRATEMVDHLEREFRKPMLTSNQVTLWGILRALGTAVPVEGFGQLFTGPQGQTSNPAAPRAIVLRPSVMYEPGGPEVLKIENRPIPVPQSGEVLIKIKAFGLNRSELFTRQGLSPGLKFPRVLGIEAVGLVESAPGGEFAQGDIVATAMGGMGRQFDGGYAEYTCVPALNVQVLKTTLSWEILGAIPEMLQTAYGSRCKSLRLQKDERLLIRGGTTSVGLAAAALAKKQDAYVCSTTRRPDREKLLRASGVDQVFIDTGSIADQVKERFPRAELNDVPAMELSPGQGLRGESAETQLSFTAGSHGLVCQSWSKWVMMRWMLATCLHCAAFLRSQSEPRTRQLSLLVCLSPLANHWQILGTRGGLGAVGSRGCAQGSSGRACEYRWILSRPSDPRQAREEVAS